jgi:hypothetical protein
MMMRDMVKGSFSFLVLAGLLSCKGDPTGDLRNGTDHLTADPTSLFVRQDSSKFVVITAVDEQGNTVAAKFSDATNVGAGITVVKDPTFAPVYNSKGELVQPPEVVATRYIVTGTANTANSGFTVSAGGKSITIPVRILPATTTLATLSTAAPNAGDTITITVPAPYKFTPASVASVAGTNLFKVSTSADSSQIKVVGPPGLNGAVNVSGIVLSYAPAAATLTVTSTVALVTPALPTVAISKTNAAIGDTVVVTVVAPYRFIAGAGGSTVTVGTANLALVSVSTDSSQLRFVIGPSANDTVRVTGIRISGAATLGPFTSKSTAKVVTPALPIVTLNKTTAVAGDTIIVTAAAGFRFTPGAGGSVPTVGAAGLAVVGVSADSSQLRFLIGPSANDTVKVTGVRFRTAPTLGPYTANSGAAKVQTPAVTDVPALFSTTTPNVNGTITITAPAGFKFLPTARVRFGIDQQATVSVAADSNSMVVRAHQAGASGQITFENIVLSFLTGVAFNAPTTTTVTVGATVIELTGTDVPANAPIISVPVAVGQTAGVVDAPTAFGYAGLTAACGGPCPTRLYKIVVRATTKLGVNSTWNSNEDVGIYLLTTAGALQSTTTFPPADNLGGGAGGHPETTTWTLPAGTYLVGAITFGAAAAPTSLLITFTAVP